MRSWLCHVVVHRYTVCECSSVMWYLCCGCSDTSSCESTSTVHRVKCDVNRSLCYGAGAPFQRGEVCEDDVVGDCGATTKKNR